MLENTLRVLVADDIASNRTIVGAFLAHLNCTPLYAADGQEAVDLFRREAPDVVLMDLMMPRMDGFEAIRQIRAMEDERWVPIIIVSALSGEGDIVQGLEIGADDYLAKPLSFPVFARHAAAPVGFPRAGAGGGQRRDRRHHFGGRARHDPVGEPLGLPHLRLHRGRDGRPEPAHPDARAAP
jgi:CheY-like chemotaxis protein